MFHFGRWSFLAKQSADYINTMRYSIELGSHDLGDCDWHAVDGPVHISSEDMDCINFANVIALPVHTPALPCLPSAPGGPSEAAVIVSLSDVAVNDLPSGHLASKALKEATKKFTSARGKLDKLQVRLVKANAELNLALPHCSAKRIDALRVKAAKIFDQVANASAVVDAALASMQAAAAHDMANPPDTVFFTDFQTSCLVRLRLERNDQFMDRMNVNTVQWARLYLRYLEMGPSEDGPRNPARSRGVGALMKRFDEEQYKFRNHQRQAHAYAIGQDSGVARDEMEAYLESIKGLTHDIFMEFNQVRVVKSSHSHWCCVVYCI